ncbi:hypothetical protein DPX16_11050 [Anabarilius grahami]|uniref:Uncharacterized protein n=1 Tax=Anabarilius grahami TaxID=495550 RepID=A0A3N0Y287_ANAGA|nr:hypothetical protein DPX16_11050 [Anabarilius grahami]
MERMPEPTADGEPKPASMYEPDKRTEPTIAPEPEPHSESDQVCEPATSSVPVGLLVEYEGVEESPAHTPVAEILLSPSAQWRMTPNPLQTQSPASHLPGDGEPKPASMYEPDKRTEPTIAPEPEPHSESDQVCEPATSSVPVGLLVEYEGMEESPAHTPIVETPSLVSPLVLPSSKSPVFPRIPPSLPLPPPLPITANSSASAPPPLFPFSSSAPPLTPLCSTDPPQAFHKDPLAPLPAAEAHHFPSARRPVDFTLSPPSLGST